MNTLRRSDPRPNDPGIDIIDAPFTPDQVIKLDAHQRSGRHPYTCSNRQDGKHFWIGGDESGDKGRLVATVRGFICHFCDYQQTWAYGMSES